MSATLKIKHKFKELDNRRNKNVLIGVLIVVLLWITLNSSSSSSSPSPSLADLETTAAQKYMKSKTPEKVTLEKSKEFIEVDGSKIELDNSGNDKIKACYVTLARNANLWDLLLTMQDLEDRFNERYHYDWVFLNDVPFTDQFIKETSRIASGRTKYGLIPKEHWSVPFWIDEEKADKAREEMQAKNVIYGGSLPYRHMCRFNSGFFYQNKLLDEYDYYWRVDTDVKFLCDINYDVFKFFKDSKKKYGFVVSIPEYIETIPSLWSTTKQFMEEYPQHIAKNNLMDFISDDGGLNYNRCHFWSNFEIGDLSFFRSKAYTDYFDYLDKSGGFFYERWGDAPVHSIAASLLLNENEVHFFEDIGYSHNPFMNCPIRESIRQNGRCVCDPTKDITFNSYSCIHKYYKLKGLEKPSEMSQYGF
ncbi:hypothetical protein DAMA08_000100 [Martiniozyma asiatica (nom. inval.)]|nr:hypothetical protein DAMA08_000100 [Martiniozyma asiatica]